jgi:hypothetical protein
LTDSIAATEYYIEDRLDEYDKYGYKTMKSLKDSVKVDEQKGPSIDIMLDGREKLQKIWRQACRTKTYH